MWNSSDGSGVVSVSCVGVAFGERLPVFFLQQGLDHLKTDASDGICSLQRWEALYVCVPDVLSVGVMRMAFTARVGEVEIQSKTTYNFNTPMARDNLLIQ